MEQPSDPLAIPQYEDNDILGTIQNLISQVAESNETSSHSPIQTPPPRPSQTQNKSGKQTPGLPLKSARAKNNVANVEDIDDSNNYNDENDHYDDDRNRTDLQCSQSQQPPSLIAGVNAEELSDDDSDVIVIDDDEPTPLNDKWTRADRQHLQAVGAAWRASLASHAVKLETADHEEVPPKKSRQFPLV